MLRLPELFLNTDSGKTVGTGNLMSLKIKFIKKQENILKMHNPRIRAKGLNYIPYTKNFSSFEPYQVEQMGAKDDEEEMFDTELILLSMLYELQNDRDRVIFLLNVMRGFGFNLDHTSIARALKLDKRWYMRIKQNLKAKLERFNPK